VLGELALYAALAMLVEDVRLCAELGPTGQYERLGVASQVERVRSSVPPRGSLASKPFTLKASIDPSAVASDDEQREPVVAPGALASGLPGAHRPDPSENIAESRPLSSASYRRVGVIARWLLGVDRRAWRRNAVISEQ